MFERKNEGRCFPEYVQRNLVVEDVQKVKCTWPKKFGRHCIIYTLSESNNGIRILKTLKGPMSKKQLYFT